MFLTPRAKRKRPPIATALHTCAGHAASSNRCEAVTRADTERAHMLLADEIVVVSDLHLAAENGRGLFQADDELADFLRWVLGNFSSCHVILNGDVFDFLVSKRQETAINLEDAATEAASIIDNHKKVFEALSLIANSDSHDLIILGGNHDPETSLPTVQEQIERSLSSSDPHDTKARCAHFPIRWLTNGEGALLQVGE